MHRAPQAVDEAGQLEMVIGDLEEDQAQAKAVAKAPPPVRDTPRRQPVRKPLPEHLPPEGHLASCQQD